MNTRSKNPCRSRRRCPSWPSDRRPEEGVALVFVLWVMVLLCAVAFELKFSSHLRLEATANMGGATKALYLARAGVERAVAGLVEERDSVQFLTDLREDRDRTYHNVEVGEGTYTLYVGLDRDGDPEYGLTDESAKINVNKAPRAALAKVPGLDDGLAAAIETVRGNEPFRDLNDLLPLEGIDLLVLYGEDQNGNGILDPNEDDGDESWPSDIEDCELDGGDAEYLTTWSAARNVTADGESRIDLNKADAEELVKSLKGITAQKAESIVAHREKNKFGSIADLLDVELMEKVEEQPKQGEQPQGQPGRKPSGPNAGPEQAQAESEGKKDDEKKEGDKESGSDKEKEGKESPENGNGAPDGKEEAKQDGSEPTSGSDKPKLKGTGE